MRCNSNEMCCVLIGNCWRTTRCFRAWCRHYDHDLYLQWRNATTYQKQVAIAMIDAVKAYDSVSREYLIATLKKMGCSSAFVRDIELILSDNQVQILIHQGYNTYYAPAYTMTRGLPQGNALSCMLFIIAACSIANVLRLHGVAG